MNTVYDTFFRFNCLQKKDNLLNTYFTPKLRSDLRIGPLIKDVISVIVGSLLGDSHLEKRKNGTSFIFEQCNPNLEYIM